MSACLLNSIVRIDIRIFKQNCLNCISRWPLHYCIANVAEHLGFKCVSVIISALPAALQSCKVTLLHSDVFKDYTH